MQSLLRSPSFELSWKPRTATLHLASPGRDLEMAPGVEIGQNGRHRLLSSPDLTAGRVSQNTVEDTHGIADQMEVCFQEIRGVALALRVRLYANRPFALLQVSVTNVGPDPIAVRRFFVHTVPGGIRARGLPIGMYLHGWQSASPSGFHPLEHHEPELPLGCRLTARPTLRNVRTPWRGRHTRQWWSETVGAVITADEALILGGASLADQFVQVAAILEPSWSDRSSVMVQSQADDMPLAVGASISSEWFYVEWVPLPSNDPLAQYAYAVMRQMALPVPRPPTTGWSSWHLLGERVAESDVMENLASAALLADEFPLRVIHLDRGYQATGGDWDTQNERFPHSLKWLADRITGSRFQAGLTLTPLVVNSRASLAHEHPDWLLRTRAGLPVSAGSFPARAGLVLDPTHPAVQDHLRAVIDRVVRQWGYTYLELASMGVAALPGVHNSSATTRAQALRLAFQTLRDAAGPEVYLVGRDTPLAPAVGLVDALRISADTSTQWYPSGRHLKRVFRRNPVMPCLRNNLRNVLSRAWIHNRWWVNASDALLLREDRTLLSEDEVLAQLTLIGLSGGSVILSDDLDNLLPERRALAAVLFPQLLDGMDVLDLFETSMPEVAIVPVARPWGRWQLIGLFNWGAKPTEVMLPEAIQLDPRKSYHLVDFWERRYLALRPGALRPVFHLPPHGVSLLSLRAQSIDPHLVATTFHISQGAEVNTCTVEPGQITLAVHLDRLASGELWLALPARPTSVTVGDLAISLETLRAVAVGIWAIPCPINRAAVVTVAWGQPAETAPA